MFISIVLDPGSTDTSRELSSLLLRYGFERVQRACWESMSMNDDMFTALKRDIDNITDYYDTVRIYQYPIQDNFAITILNKKRWRKIILRSPSEES